MSKIFVIGEGKSLKLRFLNLDADWIAANMKTNITNDIQSQRRKKITRTIYKNPLT